MCDHLYIINIIVVSTVQNFWANSFASRMKADIYKEPISMKILHVVERNVICYLLLLKIDNANRTFSYYRKY